MKNNNPETISKSNSLIEASYKLTLNEQRLIICSLQVFDQSQKMPDKIRVYASDFAKLFELEVRAAYGVIGEAASKLFERTIYTADETRGERERKRWIITQKYLDNEGAVEITYHADIKPYLSQLRDKITSYDPHRVAALTSSYSFRLFELLISHLNEGETTYDLEEFREMLGVGDKYPKFAEFNRVVLSKAVKELNKKSELDVSVSLNRSGRSITSLTFTIRDLKQRRFDF